MTDLNQISTSDLLSVPYVSIGVINKRFLTTEKFFYNHEIPFLFFCGTSYSSMADRSLVLQGYRNFPFCFCPGNAYNTATND